MSEEEVRNEILGVLWDRGDDFGDATAVGLNAIVMSGRRDERFLVTVRRVSADE